MVDERALIIDDEPDIRELLEITLNRMHIKCKCAEDLKTAKYLLKENIFDICLTDMRLPDGDGVEFVSYLQEHYPGMPVAVITAHGNMETAIQALKLGAFDFLTKPVDLELLRNLIKSALDVSRSTSTARKNLIGDSQVIRKLRETVTKLARSQVPVYISGESGVGKELVARMIHEQGPRFSQTFIPVNCGAIPHDLMESEFFGHRKGSFTGANGDKQGLFQAAEGGTLFLDEVAELPLSMQVKLLRVIQEKKIRPIGEQKETPVNVRILSATHKDIEKLVKDGHFRQDLFYRVNVIELNVPPLRERKEDIPLLVDYILESYVGRSGVTSATITQGALDELTKYPFPGNIRELENILERAITLCDGEVINKEDLNLPVHDNSVFDIQSGENYPLNLDNYLEEVEKKIIVATLDRVRWNKTAAAKELGISFRALRYRLEKLDIST